MTAEVLRTYRFRCDAAHCAVSYLSETNEAPDGWTTVDSIAHQSHLPLPSVKAGRRRLREIDVQSRRSFGRFRLHLCPTHMGALRDHTPQTDNAGERGSSVACSCGVRLAWSTEDTKTLWVQHYLNISGQSEGGTNPCGYAKEHDAHTFMRLDVLFQCPGTDSAEGEPPYIDADGMPHQPFTEDTEGVPYTYPTCGMDGEWWPCQTVRTSRADQVQGHDEPTEGDQMT